MFMPYRIHDNHLLLTTSGETIIPIIYIPTTNRNIPNNNNQLQHAAIDLKNRLQALGSCDILIFSGDYKEASIQLCEYITNISNKLTIKNYKNKNKNSVKSNFNNKLKVVYCKASIEPIATEMNYLINSINNMKSKNKNQKYIDKGNDENDSIEANVIADNNETAIECIGKKVD